MTKGKAIALIMPMLFITGCTMGPAIGTRIDRNASDRIEVSSVHSYAYKRGVLVMGRVHKISQLPAPANGALHVTGYDRNGVLVNTQTVRWVPFSRRHQSSSFTAYLESSGGSSIDQVSVDYDSLK